MVNTQTDTKGLTEHHMYNDFEELEVQDGLELVANQPREGGLNVHQTMSVW